jgi:hypothetical protein
LQNLTNTTRQDRAGWQGKETDGRKEGGTASCLRNRSQ